MRTYFKGFSVCKAIRRATWRGLEFGLFLKKFRSVAEAMKNPRSDQFT
jgi:hypothetical protein